MGDDEPTSICDKCADEIPADEANNGPEGTEWEGCVLCNECCAEVTP